MAAMRTRTRVLLTCVIVAVIILSWAIPVREVDCRIDPVTGATKTQSTWLGVFPGRVTFEPTKFDEWLAKKDPQREPEWRLLYANDVNAWNMPISFGCGFAHGSHGLRYLDRYVEQATGAELEELLALMQSDDRDQQRKTLYRLEVVQFQRQVGPSHSPR